MLKNSEENKILNFFLWYKIDNLKNLIKIIIVNTLCTSNSTLNFALHESNCNADGDDLARQIATEEFKSFCLLM